MRIDPFDEIEQKLSTSQLKEAAALLLKLCRRKKSHYEEVAFQYKVSANELFKDELTGEEDPDAIKRRKRKLTGDIFTLLTDLRLDDSPRGEEKKVMDALRIFNFEKQIQLFVSNRNEKNRLFLIHGEQNFGQAWLVDRLIRFKKMHLKRKVLQIPLRSSRGTTIEDSINLLADELFPDEFDVQHVIEKVCQYIADIIKNEHVVFIFKDSSFDEDRLDQFYHRFWKKIVSSVPENSNQQVIGFLIENQPSPQLEKIFQKETYPELIDLPCICEVNEKVISEWKDKCSGNENHIWIADFLDQDPHRAFNILHATRGEPWRFMRRFCRNIDPNIDIDSWINF